MMLALDLTCLLRVADRWEYTDGTRGSLLLFAPLTGDWTVALRRGDEPEPFSFLCHLS